MIKISAAAGAANREAPAVPLTRFKKHAKYGFALTEAQVAYCPACKHELNAGPDYMPKRCEECGQLLDWNDYSWSEPKFIKYVKEGDHSDVDDWTIPD